MTLSEDSKSLLAIFGLFAFIYVLSPRYVMVVPIAENASQGILGGKESMVASIRSLAKQANMNPDHLLALSAQESSLGKYLVGDGGCSKGFFHINSCFNDFTGYGDIEKETAWVIMKLKQYGYEKNVRLAIARYNRPNRPNFAYADKILGPRLQEVKELMK